MAAFNETDRENARGMFHKLYGEGGTGKCFQNKLKELKLRDK